MGTLYQIVSVLGDTTIEVMVGNETRMVDASPASRRAAKNWIVRRLNAVVTRHRKKRK